MRSPLALLTWLRIHGWARRMRKSASTTRGLIFLIIGIILLGLWTLSVIVGQTVSQDMPDLVNVQQTAPLLMLAMTILMCVASGSKAISFSPAEVAFLFPGPFTRRRLLLYRISFSALGSIILAVFLGIMQVRHAGSWISGFIGIYLMLLFGTIAAIIVALMRKAVADRSSATAVRAAVLILIIFSIAGLVEMIIPMVHDGVMFKFESLTYIRESLFGRAVLAPFDVLTLVFISQRIFPELLLWSAVSLMMIVLLMLLMFRLDGYFIDVSLAVSRRMEARIAKVRSGSMFARTSTGPAKRSLPMLPRLKGAGSIGWRQLTNAMRNFRGLLIMLCLMSLVAGPMIFGMSHVSEDGPDTIMIGFLSFMAIPWLLFILPMMLRFDFRSDVEQMDVLKSLPISPMAMTIGQIIAPAAVLAIIISVLMGLLAVFLPALRTTLFVSLAFVPVVTVLLFLAENAAFLLSPTRNTSAGPADIQMMGRAVVTAFIKMGLLAAAAAASAGAGGLAYLASSPFFFDSLVPLIVMSIAAWLTLVGGAYVLLRITAKLFERFDPGIHSPA